MIKKTKKEKDTMESRLARMINAGFQNTQDVIIKRLDDKIEGLDAKFEKKFEEVNYKLDKIDKKLEGQEKTIFNHDQRIDKIEVNLKLKKA